MSNIKENIYCSVKFNWQVRKSLIGKWEAAVET